MGLNNVYDGANYAAEYMVSAVPWVTASNLTSGITQFDFPTVTKFITVQNISGSDMKIGFTQNGVLGNNYYPLAVSSSLSGDFRVKSLFVSSSGISRVEILAGVTMIQTKFFPTLTGSNGFTGVG
jgi:hypothetical protein